jgi:hypothetical protein
MRLKFVETCAVQNHTLEYGAPSALVEMLSQTEELKGLQRSVIGPVPEIHHTGVELL